MSNQILEALEAFEELSLSDSRLWKIRILRKYSRNEVFTELLKATYDPFRVYHIKQLKDVCPSNESSDPTKNYHHFLSLLEDLHLKTLVGNEAREAIATLFSRLSQKELIWYTRVLKKDLNVGVQAKTINEVIPGLIPTFGVMLAQEFRGFPEEFVLQPKFDGMRILGSTTTGRLYSRKGKLVEGFEIIEEELRSLPSGFFLDGEILAGGEERSPTFNNLMTKAFRKSSNKQGYLFVFDLIPEGSEMKSILPFRRRLALLDELWEGYELKSLQPVETSGPLNKYSSSLFLTVEKIYGGWVKKGFEGAIIKDLNSPYEPKRSYAWQKLKPTQTFDLVVIDLEEGKDDTKYTNAVGRLVCDFNGVEVRVGSGLTDEQRLLWWDQPNLIIGKVVEVKAQETTINQRGTVSLRFPRLVKVRDDK